MTIVEKLKNLWESNEAKGINLVTEEALDLIRKAKSANEEVPLELETEIVLSANYSMGFGSGKEEAKILLDLLIRVVNDNPDISQDKINRLASTAASSLLGIMTTDSQNSTKKAAYVLQSYDITSTSTKSEMLRKMYNIIVDLLRNNKPTYWSLELLSFAIVYYSLLQEMEQIKAEDEEKYRMLEKIFEFDPNKKYQKNIQNWRGEWLEKSDYFRFISLMITNNHSSEDRWIENAKILYNT